MKEISTQEMKVMMMDILEDGIVTEEEMQRIPHIKRQFVEARKRADEILAAIEKLETKDRR